MILQSCPGVKGTSSFILLTTQSLHLEMLGLYKLIQGFEVGHYMASDPHPFFLDQEQV